MQLVYGIRRLFVISMTRTNSIKILLTCLLLNNSVSGIKITMLHIHGGSHHMTTRAIGEEMARRGHEVTVCVPDGEQQTDKPLKVIPFDSGVSKEEWALVQKYTMESWHPWPFKNIINGYNWQQAFSRLCESLITNPNTVAEIEKADLLIAESLLVCVPAIARRYKKPWVAIVPRSVNFQSFRIPINPSYIPYFETSHSAEMGFKERLFNTVTFIGHKIIFTFLVNYSFRRVKELLDIPASEDIVFMENEAALLLGSCDFTFDHPLPLMPNIICVGPFLTKPAKPVPEEFNSFVNTKDGFILVAFGSIFNTLTEVQVKKMVQTFKLLKQKVIWQIQEQYDIPLPENVVQLKWLPQNDLLGHPNIKLFISHAGLSSIYQAIYHGVPVVATPMTAEQLCNAYTLKNRVKMAEVIDMLTFSEEELLTTINQVMNNENYTKNAKKASRRLRTRKQTPMQLAGDLIEYVIDNDYDVSHLRSPGLDLPWYIHDLLDVYLFITGTIALCCILVHRLVRFISQKKHKTE